MSAGVIRNSGGYQSCASDTSSRPSGSAATTTSTGSSSTCSSSSSHRNRNLLDSYHDFAMQIFGSNNTQDIEIQFLQAVQNGNVERVENLLKRRSHEIFNIDVKDKETGNTPIIWAAKLGHLNITQLLLKFGVDITLRNYDNETALDVARPNILKPLLDSVSRVGCSPRHLQQAAWQGNLRTVHRLLSESKILDINCRNVEGFTPLLLVTRDIMVFEKLGSVLENYNPLAVVNELLRHRADPVARDSEGKTALHYAAASQTKLAEEIAFLLIQEPALMEVKDNRSLAPIHSASQSGQIEVVLALLDGGANVNARGFAGSTPLHVSACNGQYKVATTLLDRGADITLVDDGGNTAVDVAKTKKLKTTLKEAWTEATQSKQEVVLGPVRVPSRIGDLSSDERSPREGASSNDISPREKFMLRKFTDAHKAVLAEEQMLKDIDTGKFTPGPNPKKPSYPRSSSRNCTSPMKTPIPPRTPRVMERKKPPRSPEKTRTPKRSLSFSEKARADEAKGQRLRGHNKLCYTRSDPTGRTGASDVSQVPVTVVGLDLDESLRDIRLQRLITGPVGPIMERQQQTTHDRCGSRLSHVSYDNYQPPTSAALTNPSLTDVTDACNEYMKKGRKLGMRKASTGTDDGDSVVSWPRSKRKSPRKSHVLNLEQMHLRLSTPSPMSDCIRMFPNSRFVLPQSPAVSTMGENLLGETIFEFENENDNVLNSTTSGSFLGSRRTSLSSTGHLCNNTWRLPGVQRPTTAVSEESTSPENNEDNTDEVKARGEAASTFNIELSRVSPLKDSSDSGQGSSRSTGSQGSSFSTDSTPSPSLHAERESLVKVSVKNRLGIGMTPAATQVQENNRFYSRLRNPSTRIEETRDLRRGLVKSVLTTTIAVSNVQQLGSIPTEKQPELQPLIAKKDVGRLDTISESTRKLSADSETKESKVQNGRTPADAGCIVKKPSADAARRLSGDVVTPLRRPSVDANASRKGSKGDPINKLTVLPDVRIDSPSKAEASKSKASSSSESEQSSTSGKETVQKNSDSKKAANERIVIKKLVTSKENVDSTKEQLTNSKSKEPSGNAISHVKKPAITEKPSLSSPMQGGSKVSGQQKTNAKVEDKTSISSIKDTSKNTTATSGSKPQNPANVNISNTMNTKPIISTKENESEATGNVSKPNSQRAKCAISKEELSPEVVVGNLTTNSVTKDCSQSKLSPRKEVGSISDISHKPSGVPPKPSQKASPSLLKMSTPTVKLSPRPKQVIASNTPSQKSETAKLVNKVESKDPNKTKTTSPRKMETAKSSLTESAPGPSASNGKPALSKSFNSSDKSGIESELRKIKDEISKDKTNNNDVSSKTTVAKSGVNGQLSNTKTSGKSSEVVKTNEKEGNSNRKEVTSKNTSNVNKMDCGPGKENTKPAPVKKPPSTIPQSNKNVNNKNAKPENNSKKRSEDSKTIAKISSTNQNQKENTTKKQKVNHPVNANSKTVTKVTKSNRITDNRKSLQEEEDESDVESMEDIEEMLDAVTFISDDERQLENIVHIEIKTQEEMMADEPPKEVEKKDKLPNRTKNQNKNQIKKEGKSKMVAKSSGTSKGGKVTLVNGKPTPVKIAGQVSSKSDKTSSSAKVAKKSVKVQLNQASKSAGQKPKSGSVNLSGKHSLSMETLLDTGPAKKAVVENTPVITDIMEVIKAFNKGVTPTPWRRSVSVEELSSPRKKNVSPKRGNSGKTGKARASSERVASGSKGKGQNKPVKKQSVGSATKNKDGFATVSTKTGKPGKVSKGKLKDLQLLSESERQTTAFITGQGWQIKTDRNETDDVIIHDPQDSSDSSEEEMEGANLSPRHTINFKKMHIPALNPEVINNLANIMNPLEYNTPRYLPDTMDTIKEFADSLKSNESGDISKIVEESNNNGNSGEENGNLIVPGEDPPALPPKDSLSDKSKTDDDIRDTTENPPELPPKLSASTDASKEHDVGIDEALPPELPPKQSSTSVGETLNQANLPPELPPKLSSSQNTDTAFGDPFKESPVIKEQRTDGDGAEEDLSLNSYKTNPELLKVFHIPDHYEVRSGSKSPAKEQEAEKNNEFKDGKEESANLAMLSDQSDQSKPSDVEAGVNQQESLHSDRAIKDDVASKPPIPKTRYARKSRARLRRVNSEPACLYDTSESDEDNLDVFSPGRNVDQQKHRKASLPVRDVYSPRTKKRTENTSLAKYIREMQETGQMRHEMHKLEDLKELEEEDILRKEQLLNEHIQDMTISALQEFNSLLSPIGEGAEVGASPMQPSSAAKDQEEHMGDTGDGDLLNKSLPMSEVSEISTVRTEDGDTLVSELHSSGSISSRGFSGSSLISSERSQSSNTTTSEPEGELLHWKKGNLLGRGAFGTVYCGLTSVGQLIAVKQVELSEKDKEKSRKQYETLQEEVQLLKTLRHRNIVGFLGCCLEGSTVNIFMQFIPGGSIASLLARFGALDEPVFCRYTKMILDGTEYLHANNVIHRDIKGANIMLMSNGVIKLIDFGCAKRLCINLSQSQNLLKSMRGTPYWMAPEVIMETGHGKKSDIWSIGCTVFEMAIRKPPWSEMPPMPAIFAIGSGEQVPQLPEKFSPEARDFVNTCLTRDQTKRPSAKDLLSHSFIRNRRERFSEQFRRISGSSLEDSQITFKEQPTNRGDSTGSRSRRRESFK